MPRAVGFEGISSRRIRAVRKLEGDRTHEPTDSGKEQLRIAHAGLDLEGREPEAVQIRRVAEVAEHEDRAEG